MSGSSSAAFGTKSGEKVRAVVAFGAAFFCVFVLGWLVHVGFCAFTNIDTFTLFDYGFYTNMIWNSGRGHLYRCLLTNSYLHTHLSFSLALLGPVFYIWDHPFALWVAQWLLFVGGAALILLVGRRSRLSVDLTAGLVLLFAGYHYSQAALLSEFHGITLYLFLVPWLYYCLRFRKRLVWLPLLVILGLREDAFLVALPMLVYFGVRDKWKTGYVYAGIALAYGLIAIFGIYPMITGGSLLLRRSREIGRNPLIKGMDMGALRERGWALLWVVLPTIPFLRKKGWVPVVVFPSLALLQALGSGFRLQYRLDVHYAAPVMACLVPALVEAAGRAYAREGEESRSTPVFMSLYLVGLTLVSHFLHGFVPGGGVRAAHGRYYAKPNLEGLRALRAARNIPGKGVLMCWWKEAAFCANRADLIVWRKYRPDLHRFDLVFATLRSFGGQHGEELMDLLKGDGFGVRYFDGDYIIMERGYGNELDGKVLEAFEESMHTIEFARTLMHDVRGLDNEVVEGDRFVRTWNGAGHRAPVTLGYGIAVDLEPGSYEAVFTLRAETPKKNVRNNWGFVGIHRLNDDNALVEAEIERIETGPCVFRTQSLIFEITQPTQIEPRVTGGDAALQVEKVQFVVEHEKEPLT